MPTLLLRFIGRRYHATPWGHHVNEGLIEWPPSPWRLLRALLATGYTTGLWDGEGPPVTARTLFEKLARVLPSYRLPEVAGAHSRHYMPLARFKDRREDTTLVFDTWAQVDAGELAVTWDVELSTEQFGLLAGLAERLGYLGRSESWVEARLAESPCPLPAGFDCHPADTAPPPGFEQVPLLAPLAAKDYDQWRQNALDRALSALPEVDKDKKRLSKEDKRILSQRRKVADPYPPDVLSCLQAETAWLRRHGWSQPPGSRRVFYWRPAAALQTGPPQLRSAVSLATTVEAMLLSMTTANGNDHALPSIIRTLPQADLLHRALVSHVLKTDRAFSAALTGRDEARQPLRGPHQHAHILPLDLDDDGHLEHMLIWAPMGLDNSAQKAVRMTRHTFTKGCMAPLRLALIGSGSLADLRLLGGPCGAGLRQILGSSGGSTNWESVTPFVPPRYMKKTGRNTLEGQIMAELVSRGLPEPVRLQVIDPQRDVSALRHRHFIRIRQRGPRPPVDCGFSLQLVFAEPLEGPVCMGYGSHFGLGLFRSIDPGTQT